MNYFEDLNNEVIYEVNNTNCNVTRKYLLGIFNESYIELTVCPVPYSETLLDTVLVWQLDSVWSF